jgi:fatty acid-binding protein DegV
MVNKKGLIKIIESVIAILVIFSVLLVLSFNQGGIGPGEDYGKIIDSILEEIANNKTLRIAVLDEDLDKVRNFVDTKMQNPFLEYELVICPLGELCSLESYPGDGEVHARERIISTVPERSDFSPKKIKIYVW